VLGSWIFPWRSTVKKLRVGLQRHLRGGNENLPRLGSAQIVHDAHELGSLCAGFLCLGDMQIHLIPIKVGVVWVAHALIEAERPAKANASAVQTYPFLSTFRSSIISPPRNCRAQISSQYNPPAYILVQATKQLIDSLGCQNDHERWVNMLVRHLRCYAWVQKPVSSSKAMLRDRLTSRA